MPPPTNRKKSKGKTKSQVQAAIEVHGTRYLVEADAVENGHDLELYRQSGLTWGQVITLLRSPRGAPPPFAIGAFMFIAELQAGRTEVTYAAMVELVTYDDVMTGKVHEVDAGEVPQA